MSPKEVRKNLHHQIWYSETNQEEKEIVGYRTFTNVFNVTGRVARSETSRTVQ